MSNEEALYYSEEKFSLLEVCGDGAGVVLIEGDTTPVLWTETRSGSSLTSEYGDAVEIYRGFDREQKCKVLVDGFQKVTEEGKSFCEKYGINQTPEALRQSSLRPK